MKQFPILIGYEGTAGPCPSSIPWDVIAPYEGHAQANHQQSLQRLAERGGLSPIEAYLVMTGRRWKWETFTKEFEKEACAFLDKIVKDRSELQARLDAALLHADELQKRIYQIGLLCDRVSGLENGFCPDIGEPRDNLTRIKIALKRLTDPRPEQPTDAMPEAGCNACSGYTETHSHETAEEDRCSRCGWSGLDEEAEGFQVWSRSMHEDENGKPVCSHCKR